MDSAGLVIDSVREVTGTVFRFEYWVGGSFLPQEKLEEEQVSVGR